MRHQNTGCAEERPAYADDFVALLQRSISLRLRLSCKLQGTSSTAMKRTITPEGRTPRWRYGKRVRASPRDLAWIKLRRIQADRASDLRQASFSSRSIGKQRYPMVPMRLPN